MKSLTVLLAGFFLIISQSAWAAPVAQTSQLLQSAKATQEVVALKAAPAKPTAEALAVLQIDKQLKASPRTEAAIKGKDFDKEERGEKEKEDKDNDHHGWVNYEAFNGDTFQIKKKTLDRLRVKDASLVLTDRAARAAGKRLAEIQTGIAQLEEMLRPKPIKAIPLHERSFPDIKATYADMKARAAELEKRAGTLNMFIETAIKRGHPGEFFYVVGLIDQDLLDMASTKARLERISKYWHDLEKLSSEFEHVKADFTRAVNDKRDLQTAYKIFPLLRELWYKGAEIFGSTPEPLKELVPYEEPNSCGGDKPIVGPGKPIAGPRPIAELPQAYAEMQPRAAAATQPQAAQLK